VSNSNQEDNDDDNSGDNCDPDDDNDGRYDYLVSVLFIARIVRNDLKVKPSQ